MPDRLRERQVQGYILYVRDDLGVAKWTFAPLLAGLKFFYVNTLVYGRPSVNTIGSVVSETPTLPASSRTSSRK